jgi:capsid protein
MVSLDPTKDANAAQIWNQLGIKSKQTISAEQGVDFDNELGQRKREREQEKAAGLLPEPVTNSAPANDNQPQGNDNGNTSA